MLDEFTALWPAGVSAVLAKLSVADAPLHSEEMCLVDGVVPRRAVEIRAGRNVARQALSRLGAGRPTIPRGSGREPIWPSGFVGSISHCDDLVCAVAAQKGSLLSLGVDLEPTGRLGRAEASLVSRPDELAHYETLPALDTSNWPKIAFSAKEALYKCLYPITREMIGFLDVSLRFDINAETSAGGWRLVAVHGTYSTRLIPIRGRWALTDGYIFASATMIRA